MANLPNKDIISKGKPKFLVSNPEFKQDKTKITTESLAHIDLSLHRSNLGNRNNEKDEYRADRNEIPKINLDKVKEETSSQEAKSRPKFLLNLKDVIREETEEEQKDITPLPANRDKSEGNNCDKNNEREVRMDKNELDQIEIEISSSFSNGNQKVDLEIVDPKRNEKSETANTSFKKNIKLIPLKLQNDKPEFEIRPPQVALTTNPYVNTDSIMVKFDPNEALPAPRGQARRPMEYEEYVREEALDRERLFEPVVNKDK